MQRGIILLYRVRSHSGLVVFWVTMTHTSQGSDCRPRIKPIRTSTGAILCRLSTNHAPRASVRAADQWAAATLRLCRERAASSPCEGRGAPPLLPGHPLPPSLSPPHATPLWWPPPLPFLPARPCQHPPHPRCLRVSHTDAVSRGRHRPKCCACPTASFPFRPGVAPVSPAARPWTRPTPLHLSPPPASLFIPFSFFSFAP